MSETLVRLVDEDFPPHGPAMGTHKKLKPRHLRSWNEWRGRLIRVQLPPKPCTWPCGAKWFWRVVDEDREQIKHSVEGAFVCEHQIEID